jgi:cation diffusion facilitator CzcD-associated flavoprotein CzcO
LEQRPIEHLDVVVVGAGISGISAAYHLQTEHPGKSFAILEARAALGGTWDLFRYPGIRSDSDMHTLGFSFRPWTDAKSIADGPSILAYLQDTARELGIDRKIRLRTRVERAEWSSAAARWTLHVRDGATGALTTLTCSFLFVCAGYYDYAKGYTPDFPGRERFAGQVVHPQLWTDDVEFAGKRVVVIGSGATAITLVPALAAKAAHVTMLQRTPTYVLALPGRDPIARWLREKLPSEVAYAATRWKNVLAFMAFYQWSRRFPKRAKRWLVSEAGKQLGDREDARAHFTPPYDPWEQRLCFAPDGDFFGPIRDGRVDVVTDHVDSFTERGIRLRSGRELEADLIVTATGLKLQLFGGIELLVDGRRPEPTRSFVYRGMMVSDIPNLAFAVGYTNASWTLKVDLVAGYVCRLLRHMDANGFTTCVPRVRDRATLGEEPLIDFSSGYVQRAAALLPKQGSRAPWKLYQNYVLDLLTLRHGRLQDDALELSGPGG